MTTKATELSEINSLVGLFCHEIVDGQIKHQGLIRGEIQPGLYLIHIWSLAAPADLGFILRGVDELKSWRFYQYESHWQDICESYIAEQLKGQGVEK